MGGTDCHVNFGILLALENWEEKLITNNML